MQNLGNSIVKLTREGSAFVMSKIDAQNELDFQFKEYDFMSSLSTNWKYPAKDDGLFQNKTLKLRNFARNNTSDKREGLQ